MAKSPIADKAIPAGLRIWLVFLISFYLLGIPLPLSILFGFMGGFAGGLIFAWWQTAGGEPVETQSTRKVKHTERREGPRFKLPLFQSVNRKTRRSSRTRR